MVDRSVRDRKSQGNLAFAPIPAKIIIRSSDFMPTSPERLRRALWPVASAPG
jgi:hypothetical protein